MANQKEKAMQTNNKYITRIHGFQHKCYNSENAIQDTDNHAWQGNSKGSDMLSI